MGKPSVLVSITASATTSAAVLLALASWGRGVKNAWGTTPGAAASQSSDINEEQQAWRATEGQDASTDVDVMHCKSEQVSTRAGSSLHVWLISAIRRYTDTASSRGLQMQTL